MDSLDDTSCWDFLDYSFIDQAPSDFLWPNHSLSTEIDIPDDAAACEENIKKRVRTDSCCKAGSKACREKLRRERLNERFCDLSSVLEPGRPLRTDKPSILDDAIRVLSQLKTEAEELKTKNEKLLEEIKCLKAEKNELREEKLVLKADKERIEKQLKSMPVAPAGFMAPPVAAAAAYQAGVNKMAVYPNYGYIPMWQYLPQSARDTSQDHELRPPAA
ncbi:hypothetical protein PHAVU_007G272600 [Phaseolus vulgaris]|uniref:BHLH domain-containing protein n=1 Tax=Phaseolus vulgaris TaxID=3885 RepID=V7BIQ1_PHAVU|nr:hypothetical protein PHAVU_007G272600g [Phaseolus vulgaris]ESW17834.1 hypothetical protein PHAVU_007G272600g [Phaseolus vulgaris]